MRKEVKCRTMDEAIKNYPHAIFNFDPKNKEATAVIEVKEELVTGQKLIEAVYALGEFLGSTSIPFYAKTVSLESALKGALLCDLNIIPELCGIMKGMIKTMELKIIIGVDEYNTIRFRLEYKYTHPSNGGSNGCTVFLSYENGKIINR